MYLTTYSGDADIFAKQYDGLRQGHRYFLEDWANGAALPLWTALQGDKRRGLTKDGWKDTRVQQLFDQLVCEGAIVEK